jgi:hypothetical protein
MISEPWTPCLVPLETPPYPTPHDVRDGAHNGMRTSRREALHDVCRSIADGENCLELIAPADPMMAIAWGATFRDISFASVSFC